MVFPWPSRKERKARVEAARYRVEQARRKNTETEQLRCELVEIMQRNHFAQAIVEGLMQHHEGQQ